MNELGKKAALGASHKASLAAKSQVKGSYGLFHSLSPGIQGEVSSFLSLSDLAHLWSAKRLDRAYPADYVLIQYYEREFAPLPWKKFNRPKDVIQNEIWHIFFTSPPLKVWLQNKNFETAKAGLRGAVDRRLTSMVRQMLHQLIPGLMQKDLINQLSEVDRKSPEAVRRAFYTEFFSTPGPDLLEYEEGLVQAFIDMPELVNWLFEKDFNTAVFMIGSFGLGYEKSNPIFRFDALVENVLSTCFEVEDPYGAEDRFSGLMRTTFIHVLRSRHRPTIDYFLSFPNTSRFSEAMTSIFNNPLERYDFLEALIELRDPKLRDKLLEHLPKEIKGALLTPAVKLDLGRYVDKRNGRELSAHLSSDGISIVELTAKPLQAAVRNLDWESLEWLLSHYSEEDRAGILGRYKEAGVNIVSSAFLNNHPVDACYIFIAELRRHFFPGFKKNVGLILDFESSFLVSTLVSIGQAKKLSFVLRLCSNPGEFLAKRSSDGRSALHTLIGALKSDVNEHKVGIIPAFLEILDCISDQDRIDVLQLTNAHDESVIQSFCCILYRHVDINFYSETIKDLFLKVAVKDRVTLFRLIPWKKMLDYRGPEVYSVSAMIKVIGSLPRKNRVNFFHYLEEAFQGQEKMYFLQFWFFLFSASGFRQLIDYLISEIPEGDHVDFINSIPWKAVFGLLAWIETPFKLESISLLIDWLPERSRMSVFCQGVNMEFALKLMDSPTFQGFLNLFPKSERWKLIRQYRLGLDEVIEISKDLEFFKPELSDCENWLCFCDELIFTWRDFSRGSMAYGDFNSTLFDARSSVLLALEKALDMLHSLQASGQLASFQYVSLMNLIRECKFIRDKPVVRAHRGFFWFQRLSRTYTADRMDYFIGEFSAILNECFSLSITQNR